MFAAAQGEDKCTKLLNKYSGMIKNIKEVSKAYAELLNEIKRGVDDDFDRQTNSGISEKISTAERGRHSVRRGIVPAKKIGFEFVFGNSSKRGIRDSRVIDGETVYFYHTPKADISPKANAAVQLAERFGLKGIIFSGKIKSSFFKTELLDDECASAGIGELFFGNNCDAGVYNVVAHEVSHEYITLELPEALEYQKAIKRNIDTNSREYKKFCAMLKAAGYKKSEYDGEIEGFFDGWIFAEACGKKRDSKKLNDYKAMFKDFNEVVDAFEIFVNATLDKKTSPAIPFLNKKGIRFSKKIHPNHPRWLQRARI